MPVALPRYCAHSTYLQQIPHASVAALRMTEQLNLHTGIPQPEAEQHMGKPAARIQAYTDYNHCVSGLAPQRCRRRAGGRCR